MKMSYRKMEKINFKDLDVWVKIGIIGGWIALIMHAITFIVGFIIGLLS